MDLKTGPLVHWKVTDASKGEVQAVFSTLNVVDKDGDVTLPGAFGQQNVRISAYNHQSWQGELPIGKGMIAESGNEAILKGRFFMNVPKARDTFLTVQEMGDPGMEWSYGYDVLESSQGKWPDANGNQKDVQFLHKLKVHEVSPVILGAGENTRTLSAKSGLKAALTPTQRATAARIAQRITALLDGSKPPDAAAVDNLIDQLERAIGVNDQDTVAETDTSGRAAAECTKSRLLLAESLKHLRIPGPPMDWRFVQAIQQDSRVLLHMLPDRSGE